MIRIYCILYVIVQWLDIKLTSRKRVVTSFADSTSHARILVILFEVKGLHHIREKYTQEDTLCYVDK